MIRSLTARLRIKEFETVRKCLFTLKAMQTKQFPAIEMIIMIAKQTTMKYRIISCVLVSPAGLDTFAVVVLLIVTVEFTIVVVVLYIV